MPNSPVQPDDELLMAFYADPSGYLKAVEWNKVTGEERCFWLKPSDAAQVYHFLEKKGHTSKDSLLYLSA